MSGNRLTADQARNKTKEAEKDLIELYLDTVYEHIENTSDEGESYLVISQTRIVEDSLTRGSIDIPDMIQQSICSQLEKDGYSVRKDNQDFKIDWTETRDKSV